MLWDTIKKMVLESFSDHLSDNTGDCMYDPFVSSTDTKKEKIMTEEDDSDSDSSSNFCESIRNADNSAKFKVCLNCNPRCESCQCPSCSGPCIKCHGELTSFGEIIHDFMEKFKVDFSTKTENILNKSVDIIIDNDILVDDNYKFICKISSEMMYFDDDDESVIL